MYFFNDTISIYTIAFGSLFNNVKVHRIDKSQEPPKIREIEVPLIYSNKTHWYYKQHKDFPDKFNINKVLPSMNFLLTDIGQDLNRQTNKFETVKFDADVTRQVREWVQTAVPYTFSFNLSILTKMHSELNQILEQILPFFPAGSRDLHVQEVPSLGVYRSVRLTLDSVSNAVNIDYQNNDDRVLSYDLGITLDGYLYPPIKEKELITQVDMNVYMQMLEANVENQPAIQIVKTLNDTTILEG